MLFWTRVEEEQDIMVTSEGKFITGYYDYYKERRYDQIYAWVLCAKRLGVCKDIIKIVIKMIERVYLNPIPKLIQQCKIDTRNSDIRVVIFQCISNRAQQTYAQWLKWCGKKDKYHSSIYFRHRINGADKLAEVVTAPDFRKPRRGHYIWTSKQVDYINQDFTVLYDLDKILANLY